MQDEEEGEDEEYKRIVVLWAYLGFKKILSINITFECIIITD